MKIIASLTTIPSRIAKIRPVIESILKQTVPIEHIEINVPVKCLRLGTVYTIPEWFKEFDQLKCFTTPDYGAVTKVAPTFMRHRDDDYYIWSVDDDHVIPPYQLSLLVQKMLSENKTRIICRQGGLFDDDYHYKACYGDFQVDIFEAYNTVLYPPRIIDSDFEQFLDYVALNPDCRTSDDMVLSLYFREKKVPIWLFNVPSDDIPFHMPGLVKEIHNTNALHIDNGGSHISTYCRVGIYVEDFWKKGSFIVLVDDRLYYQKDTNYPEKFKHLLKINRRNPIVKRVIKTPNPFQFVRDFGDGKQKFIIITPNMELNFDFDVEFPANTVLTNNRYFILRDISPNHRFVNPGLNVIIHDGQSYPVKKYHFDVEDTNNGAVLTKNKHGYFWVLEKDAFIGNDLLLGRPWEENLITIVLPCLRSLNDSIFLDIGAHIGTWSVTLCNLIPTLRAYSFEAQERIFRLLKKNIEQNHLTDKINAFNYAVGHLDNVPVSLEDASRDGPPKETGKDNLGGIQLGKGEQKVVMRKLDVLPIPKVGFIKIDIEGSEPLALFGARELIQRDKPIILYEKNHKVITSSMREIMDIPNEVETFNIAEFVKPLGYSDPFELTLDNYIVFPRQECDITKFKTFEMLSVVSPGVLNNGWRIEQIKDNLLFLSVDNRKYFGLIVGNSVRWNNDTEWTILGRR